MNVVKKSFQATMYAFKRVFIWGKRAFTGNKFSDISNFPETAEYPKDESVSQTQPPDMHGGEQEEKTSMESPSALLRKAFFKRKTAVVALVLLIALFLFVFIAPAFVAMDVNYTDPLQQNVAPQYNLRRVPRRLKGEIAEIDGFSGFTVGLSTVGEVFVWGDSKDKLSKTDVKRVPQEVQEEGAAFVAAGKDHVLALTQTGKLVGWGDNSCGQYGFESVLNAISTPQELIDGIAPNQVKQLTCGYQTSALITTDGRAYVWGNENAVKNLSDFAEKTDVEKLAFTNSAAVAITKTGEVFTGSAGGFTSAVSSNVGRVESFTNYAKGKRAVEIAATNKCIAVLFDGGELVVSGVFENGEDTLPALQEGEYFLSLDGGTRHFVGVTNYGNAYAWGHNAYGQCNVSPKNKKEENTDKHTARAYAGALQSYVIDEEGALIRAAGLKGYVMGTDGRGRDVFARIVHGGKMTMTIGGVAVLVSSIIAIVIGCVSGYFGGAVDTLLMRITEIFSSIPFLPFAMLLSQIIKNYNVSETMRIFIIMLILGALSWTGLARMIRGQVLAEREKEFVTAARALGVKESKIAFRHVLPNVVSVILVSITLDFAGCLLTESALSYLGFGVQQPQPTWGNMLTGANSSIVIQNYWWQWLFPALFLSIATVCINVVGDALRDALDPKSHKEW